MRFLARMCGRATPFGLFAGVSTGAVGRRDGLVLEGRETYRRHTRLDASFLVEALERLDVARQREATAYVPNPSLYRAGDRRRYVRSRPGADERRHLLVSVRDSAALDGGLEAAAGGAAPAPTSPRRWPRRGSTPSGRGASSTTSSSSRCSCRRSTCR